MHSVMWSRSRLVNVGELDRGYKEEEEAKECGCFWKPARYSSQLKNIQTHTYFIHININVHRHKFQHIHTQIHINNYTHTKMNTHTFTHLLTEIHYEFHYYCTWLWKSFPPYPKSSLQSLLGQSVHHVKLSRILYVHTHIIYTYIYLFYDCNVIITDGHYMWSPVGGRSGKGHHRSLVRNACIIIEMKLFYGLERNILLYCFVRNRS